MPSSPGPGARGLDEALRFLKNRPRSLFEIKEKLKPLGLGSGEMETVLGHLEARGLAGDEAFALWWVQDRVLSGKSGPLKIRAELESKGVTLELIQATLAEVFPLSRQREILVAMEDKSPKGAARALRQGFDEEQVAEVFGYSV